LFIHEGLAGLVDAKFGKQRGECHDEVGDGKSQCNLVLWQLMDQTHHVAECRDFLRRQRLNEFSRAE